MTVKHLAVLGSTGSIGENTLKSVRALGPERVRVSLLAANSRIERLAEQAREFRPDVVITGDEKRVDALRALLPGYKVYGGEQALCRELHSDSINTVLCAIAGSAGLMPALESVQAGKYLALATKEALVMAGRLMNQTARERGTTIFPVDSEHSAIYQCLEGYAPETVRELVLTASGGPFRGMSQDQLHDVTWSQALKHPTWSMGPKISLDSSTLVNKALEMIEAHWLFAMPPERIKAVIHPQSIIHSMIRFRDGALLAQLSATDMRFAIQYALTYPERVKTDLPELDFTKLAGLTFESADPVKYPALALAQRAMVSGNGMSVVLNAANEAAGLRFRNGEIRFTDICPLISAAMDDACGRTCNDLSLDDIMETDRRAREFAMHYQMK